MRKMRSCHRRVRRNYINCLQDVLVSSWGRAMETRSFALAAVVCIGVVWPAFAQVPPPQSSPTVQPLPVQPPNDTITSKPPAPGPEQAKPNVLPGIAVPEVQVVQPEPVAPTAPVPTKKSPVRAATLSPSAPPAQPIPVQPSPVVETIPSGAPNVGSGPVAAPTFASQLTVTHDEINARPVTRPGEVLEATPGLIVTQHSGDGKANQYFLRGYNLDHGTDFAISVDDMPINLRTHAHGQGYSDLNWLMPELINSVDVRKGPYFADEGDFGSAGNLHIGLIDGVDKSIASLTIGSFGYARVFGASSTKAGDGKLLIAGEVATYDGPWVNPDDIRKLNGIMRYSQGTALDGFTLTGMAYSNKWNSTDQVPARAIASGQLDRFGEEDPTDGGNTTRFALSTRLAKSDDSGSWKANAYIVKSELDLFNNFTYFLNDPVNGDQFHQHDDRLLIGANASRSFNGSLAGLRTETNFGIHTRYDNIDLSLTDTFQRYLLSVVRSDRVDEGSVGVYAENTIHWTDWFRTTIGIRGDYFDATVKSLSDSNNSGHVSAALGSPKFSAVLGPFYKTEFFFGGGYGFHSNDARGATITESPTDPTTKLDASPLLVRTKGAEVGIRTTAFPGLDSSVSVFILDQASELVFSGDAGDTSASRGSRRYGVEFANSYKPYSWLTFDGDVSLSHARFVGYDTDQANVLASLTGPSAQLIGNAPGHYIQNSPKLVASAGITVGEPTGLFGTLRWRFLGQSPLTEDNAFRSPVTNLFNGRVGYRYDNGWSIQLDALNLLNNQTNQINYAYGSLLKSDPLYSKCFPVQTVKAAVCQTGVNDLVIHPAEPIAFRLSLTGTF